MSSVSEFKVLFLGTGVSTAIPNISHVLRRSNTDAPCPICAHAISNPGSKNKRNNVSIALIFQENGLEKCIVVDVGKTMRDAIMTWLPKHNIEEVHGILITHGHADAMMGLDDVRDLQKVERVAVSKGGETQIGFRVLSGPLPIYMTKETKETVFKVFPYLTGMPQYLDEASNVIERRVALLSYHEIDDNATLSLNGLHVRCFPVWHGGQYVSLGFSFGRAGEFVYISDVKIIPVETMQYLHSLPVIKVLVLDVLDREGIFSHIGLEEALDICNVLKPLKVYFTGMCCELGLHDEVEEELRERGFENYFLAYDGLMLDSFLN